MAYVTDLKADGYNQRLTPSFASNEDLTTWTETDSGSNVTVASNLATITGNGSSNVNGIRSPVADLTAIDFIEFDFSVDALAGSYTMGVCDTTALEASGNCTLFVGPNVGELKVGRAGGHYDTTLVVAADTTYTARCYPVGALTASAYTVYYTIQGGAFTMETALGLAIHGTNAPAAETAAYIQFQVTSSGDTLTISNVKIINSFAEDPPAAGGKSIWQSGVGI